jgi:hypothetical protein
VTHDAKKNELECDFALQMNWQIDLTLFQIADQRV